LVPEQDWVVKVDWKNGKGSGQVLWRLGKDGDFQVESTEKNPWFSFQHDVGYEPAGSNILTVLDDAPGMHEKDKKAGTRAQVWKLDEEKLIATLIYNNVDLGVHSICCGSIQTLPTGGYSSQSGWVLPSYGRTVETDKDSKIVFAVDVDGAVVYRSYRVADMYSAPVK